MTSDRIVAIIGRPNVGKSRLFNRLAGRRVAIVHDQPGITRDVNSVEVTEGQYTLLDTGGLGLVENEVREKKIVDAVEQQVFLAVNAAKLLLFVVDGKTGPAPMDEIILEKLRRSGKPIMLVINKLDHPNEEAAMGAFRSFGLKQSIPISAEHGLGEEELCDAILKALGPVPEAPEKTVEQRRLRICFAGRPNVGKSSLCNRLFASERLVVSEVPGTTRDSIELNLDYTAADGEIWPFRLVDTAGIRKIVRLKQPVDYFSTKRTEDAIKNADVVFLVLDAQEGITAQDQAIAGQVIESGKLLAVLVNKWDLAEQVWRDKALDGYERFSAFRDEWEAAARDQLFFLPDSPFHFVSAKTGLSINSILETARVLDGKAETNLQTAKVNAVLAKLLRRRSPRFVKNQQFKIYYATQTGHRPFRFRVFCNKAGRLDESYRRYLERGLVEAFDLQGCPIHFQLIGKEPRGKKGK